jgi:hypothetical protein
MSVRRAPDLPEFFVASCQGTTMSSQFVNVRWNRIQLIVEDLGAEVERLRATGLRFRNEIVTGPGGSQIHPSGNIVELFQPAAHRPAAEWSLSAAKGVPSSYLAA